MITQPKHDVIDVDNVSIRKGHRCMHQLTGELAPLQFSVMAGRPRVRPSFVCPLRFESIFAWWERRR